MKDSVKQQLIDWAEEYNDPKYFIEDPISFPRKFYEDKASLQDVEISAIFAAHLAWGRRSMIVRDCNRLFDYMQWKPYDYVMSGQWKNDPVSIHRTIKWSDIADICRRLKDFYVQEKSLEILSTEQIRTSIFGQKEDKKAANKKINMMRRWLVRDDDKVDLGLWKNSDKSQLIIPLDVHVYNVATELGLTTRKPKDIVTAVEITNSFKDIFPNDPCKGDFALFGYGVNNPKK